MPLQKILIIFLPYCSAPPSILPLTIHTLEVSITQQLPRCSMLSHPRRVCKCSPICEAPPHCPHAQESPLFLKSQLKHCLFSNSFLTPSESKYAPFPQPYLVCCMDSSHLFTRYLLRASYQPRLVPCTGTPQ